MQPGWYPTPQGRRYWDGQEWIAPAGPQSGLVTQPVLGWILLAMGSVVILGSFMNWVSAFGGLVSTSGVDGGDGWITVAVGLLIAGIGLAAGLKQGLLPFAIVGAVVSLAAAGLAVCEIYDVRSADFDVGAGLWAILFAAVVSAALTVAGAFLRIPG